MTRKKSTAAIAAAMEPNTAPKTRKPGKATKRPADLKKAVRQPPTGKKPTPAQVRKARAEWGVTAYVEDGEWIALRPKHGRVVHAALNAKATHTLCWTPTSWKDGAEQADTSEMDCVFCQARILSFGAKG